MEMEEKGGTPGWRGKERKREAESSKDRKKDDAVVQKWNVSVEFDTDSWVSQVVMISPAYSWKVCDYFPDSWK